MIFANNIAAEGCCRCITPRIWGVGCQGRVVPLVRRTVILVWPTSWTPVVGGLIVCVCVCACVCVCVRVCV